MRFPMHAFLPGELQRSKARTREAMNCLFGIDFVLGAMVGRAGCYIPFKFLLWHKVLTKVGGRLVSFQACHDLASESGAG